MIVVDASVAAKWLLPEPGQAEADALLRDSSALLAPALIRQEVASAVTRRVRLGTMPPEEARERYRTWSGLLRDGALVLMPDEELLDQAVELSVHLKHSLPDCLYLAAAQRRRVPLITADRTFHDRAVASYPDIRLLPGCDRN
jgi:predicted nucleic acid-binding protein